MRSGNLVDEALPLASSVAILCVAILATVGCHAPGSEEAEAIPTQTSDMQVPADFLFPTNFELAIEVDVRERLPGRSYFQICSSFAKVGDRYQIDYGSCLLRGPVIEGRLSQKVLVANHLEHLIVEILRFDESAVPEHFVFDTVQLRTLEVLSIP